ncbi:leukocyte receptor cluster member 8 homolog [Diabrotica undecimpunctata]|uniref:leukocyte receptor cluster member 8 homolog n=1 Tax=Diabrotica undecimpunctata TaxID=50387 RepID=UPI003B641FBD
MNDTEVASIPPPPGTIDNPPLPPEPPSSPPPPPPATEHPQTANLFLQNQNWANYNNYVSYYQQYAQYYPYLFMSSPYPAYHNQFNKKDDSVQPPLPPGSPNPPLPSAMSNNIRSPLLNSPKQFGHIRFQLNSKRLPNPNSNPIMKLHSSTSGAAKKRRKRNKNNQNNTINNQNLNMNMNNTPPLPPPELSLPKPAPPPPELPPEPPLPPMPVDVNPPLPPQEPQDCMSQNGLCNPSEDWPESLKDYVLRSYAKCRTEFDKNQVQIILKGKITQACQNGQLYKDWCKEPLPNIHSERQPFTGQVKTVPGQLSQFQNNNKKGLSPGLGARLGSRSSIASTLRGKSKSSSRSRSRSPVARKKSTSRSPRKNGSYSDTSTSSSEDSYKSDSKSSRRSKNKISDRLGVSKNKNQKSSKKQKPKDKKSSFYSTFGSEVEENKEVLQQRAARFGNNKSNVNNGYEKNASFVIDKFSDDNNLSGNFEWSDGHIVGTCQDLEKSFLRLTKAVNPCEIRPIEVLKLSLQNVKDKWVQKQDYFYACDQLKSIRQDLTVQGIRNEFTVEVYETHARIAIEKGDHEEFNQCQAQLILLYQNIGGSNRTEFVAYRILYYIFVKNTLDIMTVMKSLTKEEKSDECISFALKIRSAWGSGNFHKFFFLYCRAPFMTGYLLNWFIERERKDYLKCIIKSYRQSVSIDFLVQELAFENVEECFAFLEQFSLVFADSERTLLDCKSSMSALPCI